MNPHKNSTCEKNQVLSSSRFRLCETPPILIGPLLNPIYSMGKKLVKLSFFLIQEIMHLEYDQKNILIMDTTNSNCCQWCHEFLGCCE